MLQVHDKTRSNHVDTNGVDPRRVDADGFVGVWRQFSAQFEFTYAATVCIFVGVFRVCSLFFACRVYEIEKKIKTSEKFMFPKFEMINWFAAQKLVAFLHEINKEDRKCPAYVFVGLKALLASLKLWNSERDVSKFPFV